MPCSAPILRDVKRFFEILRDSRSFLRLSVSNLMGAIEPTVDLSDDG